MSKPVLEFRQLTNDDLPAFREVRLEAIKNHPPAFLGSYEEEQEKDDAYFRKQLHGDKVFGCFSKRSGNLLGMVGYYVVTPEGKRAHSVKIWGFYIRPEYRGRGFAKKLFKAALDDAAESGVEKALLKVYARNRSAIRLYEKVGFTKYGFEARSLKIGDKYYDDLLMVKFLDH